MGFDTRRITRWSLQVRYSLAKDRKMADSSLGVKINLPLFLLHAGVNFVFNPLS